MSQQFNSRIDASHALNDDERGVQANGHRQEVGVLESSGELRGDADANVHDAQEDHANLVQFSLSLPVRQVYDIQNVNVKEPHDFHEIQPRANKDPRRERPNEQAPAQVIKLGPQGRLGQRR